MSSSQVLRFPREEGGFILVQVSSRGKKPLDVDLIGTENENPYFVSIHQDKLMQLKAENDNVDDAAWIAAVSWALLRTKPSAAYQQLVDRLEVVASIEKQQRLVLKFRQDIEGGIKPRIGSITLALDETQELDLFEWAGILAKDVAAREETAGQLAEQVHQQKVELESLKSQLDEFIKLKTQDEDQLLEKFRQLLNTKKLKIRDQQRLLAGATVDPTVVAKVKDQRQTRLQHSGASRGSNKRKAQGGGIGATKNDGDGQKSDAETMDQAATESEEDFERMDTPKRSDSEEGNSFAKGSQSGVATTQSPSKPVEDTTRTVEHDAAEVVEEEDETDDEL